MTAVETEGCVEDRRDGVEIGKKIEESVADCVCCRKESELR